MFRAANRRLARLVLVVWRPGRRLHALAAVALALLAAGTLVWRCSGYATSLDVVRGNLLAGRLPSKSSGVQREEVLTDGVVSRNGSHWATELTAIFSSTSSFVEYDLGRSHELRAAYLQGDNNDVYVVEVSEDGVTFASLWAAAAHASAGQQERYARDLSGKGRYVRIKAQGGDHSYSLSEVQLFSVVPDVFPPRPTAGVTLDPPERIRTGLLLFGLALVTFFVASCRGSRWMWILRGGATVFVLWTGWSLWRAFSAAWPVGQQEVSFVRGTAAAVAALIVLGEASLARRLRPHRWVAIGLLGICGAGAVDCFYNLGYPQFRDHKSGRPTLVHNFDMRVYYPVAKYFKELGFDGLYLASVAAYVDDDPGVSLSSLASVELRDLRTHQMMRVGECQDLIKGIKERFSPDRWRAFREDMRYFRETMGVHDYLGTLSDHGGNATPVWIAIAHIIFARTHAGNTTLLVGAALDPLLLLLMFVVVGRTFGLRTMAVAMAVFGANDFYMFGSNWAGATLRHDWLAYLGLGICALRSERWTLGGALLGLSAMIRAFPALAVVGAAIPFGWALWEHRRSHGRFPSLAEIWRERGWPRVALGAALCVAGVWLLSSLVLSFDAWPTWLHKVSLLDRDPHVNHISLRALVAGSGGNQLTLLRARMPVFVAAIAASVAALVAAGRGKRLDQGATLGLLLIPVAFNPANYYIHFVCLLPLLATEASKASDVASAEAPLAQYDAASWIALLAVCVAQYWTVLERDLELHFQYATALFFAGAAVVVVNGIRQGLSRPPSG